MKRRSKTPTLARLLLLLTATTAFSQNQICQQLSAQNRQSQTQAQQQTSGYEITLRVLRNQSYSTYTYNTNATPCDLVNTQQWAAVCAQINGAQAASMRINYFSIQPYSFVKSESTILRIPQQSVDLLQKQLGCQSG